MGVGPEWPGAVALAFALASALLTLNVWLPFRRPAELATASWVLGYAVGEFALHHVALQVVVFAGLAAAGALASDVGRAAAGIATASWLGLALHYARGRSAGRVLERALEEAFGPGHRDRIDAPLRTALPTSLEWGRIAWPFRSGAEAFEARTGVPFSPDVPDLGLDVFAPRDAAGARPVLLYIHGGGWTIGSRRMQGRATAAHAARTGWVCVNVDYRLSPRATFPDHVIDVKRAIAWVREHAHEIGADPGCIVLAGGSAGGHLAALAALTPGEPRFQPGFEGADTRVQGCAAFYGVFDWTEARTPWPNAGLRRTLERVVVKARRAEQPEPFTLGSPIHHVGADAPPFLLVHGTADSMVPLRASTDFHAALRAAGADAALAVLDGAQHAFELMPTLRGQHARLALSRFLALVETRVRRKDADPAPHVASG